MSILINDMIPPAESASGTRRGPASDRYDALVHWLKSLGDPHRDAPVTVGVTSCCPRAGVSTVAADLARAAATICEQPVLLLDLSSSRSAHGTRFGVSGDLGLAEAMDDPAQAPMWAKPSAVPNLSLMAMNVAGDAAGLKVDGRRMSELMLALEREFGFVVLDLPTTESSLCYATAGLLGGVLLVIEAQRTRTDLAAQANLWLSHAQAKVFGVILNKNPQ